MGVSGGITGYRGYEYQFRVSVWLALQAYQTSAFREFQIETDFGDDASLQFEDLANSEEKSLVLTQTISKRTVRVQIKTRGQNKQWDLADFREILLKRDESQPSNPITVAQRLESNPTENFVFVTNGNVNPSLAPLLEGEHHLYRDESDLDALHKKLISSTRDQELKTEVRDSLTIDSLKRCAINHALSFEIINDRVRLILLERFGIPLSETEQIYRRLLDIVRDCAIRKNGQSKITANDLREIVGSFERDIPFPSVPPIFCATNAYQEAGAILDDRHLVLLIGEPAVGKSTVAQQLVNDFSKRAYQCNLTGSEPELDISRACLKPDCVIFLIDDPFGTTRYDELRGRTLAQQFELLLTKLKDAKGRVKVIITSRRDIWQEVANKVTQLIEGWSQIEAAQRC